MSAASSALLGAFLNILNFTNPIGSETLWFHILAPDPEIPNAIDHWAETEAAKRRVIRCLSLPRRSVEEVEAFLPRAVFDAKGYAGCFGVYPRRRVVSKLEMPKECIEHPYSESHELLARMEETVPDRSAFGTHWGLVFFFGDDPVKMRDLLKAQEYLDFYV